MATASKAAPSGIDPGTLEIKAAKELTIIQAIQRQPTDTRLRQLANNWDPGKVGLIKVARITEGEYKGKLHPYDGGCRVKAQVLYGSDVYPFVCHISSMTLEEAAEKFLDENQLSMKPSAFARYSVGIRAGREEALAIQQVLAAMGIEASPSKSTYGNGAPAQFAAFAAAERIVKKEYAVTGDWDSAGAMFGWCLDMGRLAYPQHGDLGTAHGHDADVIQALAVIASLNPIVRGDADREAALRHSLTTWLGQGEVKERLRKHGEIMEPSHWRMVVIAVTKGQGGSTSRGNQMARQIILNHNQQYTPRLRAPAPV